MARFVQCVPNFSEGRRPEVVEKIVEAIASASVVKVVDYSMDLDHNRCVVTFIGEPDDVRVSMLAGARVAVELIDMNLHEGGHPRIGAVDVVPVVPLQDITMDETVALAHNIGGDIADQLKVPVYFYEECALRGHCVNLANIRRGGYESLRDTGLVGDREPDLGPRELHPTAGATVVGARGPLIAYNINLATNNIHVARKIAAEIRRLRDSGEGMPGVKAIGVYLRSRGIAQVSMNITRPDLINIYDVYSFVEREAKALGVDVLESELIGAMREEAIVNAVRSAMKFRDLTEKRILDYWMR
ncbi:MAG: glutamate formimidoyltransferase [Armatimonadota bacterium]|nr:glutamate formimidoyltransferase [bacterium]